MKYLNKYNKFFESSQDQNITLDSGDQITVPFGEFLNINALPELPLDHFKRVLYKLRNVFNILGLYVDFKNPITNHHSDSIKHYSITFNFNLVQIPYSICWICLKKSMRESDAKGINEPRVPLQRDNDTSNFDHQTVHITKNIRLVKDPVLEVISPNTDREAYRLLIDKLVYYVDISTSSRIRVGMAHSIYIAKLKTMMVNFINDNRFFDKDIILSEEVMDQFYDTIKNEPDLFKLINNIKTHQPILYNALTPYFNELDMGAEMGELGFS